MFVGAGIASHSSQPDGRIPPTGDQLAAELARHFRIAAGESSDLSTVAQVVELRAGRDKLESFLIGRLANLEPDPVLRWLFGRPWAAIFTTNYDRVIQRAYEHNPDPVQRPVTITSNADLVKADPRFDVEIYHLHGSLFEGEERFALITETDYARFRKHRSMLFELLKQNYATLPILYVGYSGRDPNWRQVLEELREEFQPNQPPISFRVAPETSVLEMEVLEAAGIVTIAAPLAEFADLVRAELGDARVLPFNPTEAERRVPRNLLAAFRENAAPVLRLLSSWTYVNQPAFAEPPNTRAFLDGDHPNWTLIANKHHFTRDLEAILLDDLYDFATSPERDARAILAVGPAGFGTSTLLMSIAVDLAENDAGHVFYLRRGRSILPGDVDYVTRAFKEPVFLIVDNAAEHSEVIGTLLPSLQSSQAHVCFVLGERVNEWRQARSRLRPREYELASLSEREISRLLTCLARHSALGRLTDLDDELKREAIRQRYNKDLLVVMKEATQGLSFNTIIDDEFRGIVGEQARSTYACVSAFSRFRSECRDSVLAQMVGCSMQELYVDNGALEGVVYWDIVDETRGTYAARARHHLIAEVVWQRSLDPAERLDIMHRAIRSLNLNYGADARAFDKFVRADDVLSDMASLDAKVAFFESACVLDPRSPYVRQHYGRMLRREGHLELALAQIDRALELGKDVRILHHTRGMVLSDMAEQATSLEIARRRMMQAEAEFNQTIALSRRDDYGYRGLADLYLGWAQKLAPSAESNDYVRRAEAALSQGLREARNKQSLWIASADVSKWLGNHPDAVGALVEAVRAAPENSIARQLLGRVYFEAERFEEAKEVLRPLIEAGTDEYRSVLLYARVLYASGASPGECVAVLNLGELYGMRDSRFVAFYGGMLFLSGEFAQAKAVFEKGRRRGFSASEADRVELRPLNAAGDPLLLVGKVVSVRPGYCFVRSEQYPDDWFVPGFRLGALDAREGLEVRFSPGFTARGPIATQIEEKS